MTMKKPEGVIVALVKLHGFDIVKFAGAMRISVTRADCILRGHEPPPHPAITSYDGLALLTGKKPSELATWAESDRHDFYSTPPQFRR